MGAEGGFAWEMRGSPETGAARNELFVAECLKRLNAAQDPETGLRELLRFLGETLCCERVYVFEDMDRQYLRNTYEWCGKGVASGIEQLPYVTKKDLTPWYDILVGGGSIMETNVAALERENPLIYGFLAPQGIRSLVLTPLMEHGRVSGLLGADNPPPDRLEHMSVVFGALAYFVTTLLGQRDLDLLRAERERQTAARPSHAPPEGDGKTVLLVDGSRELLWLNTRVLQPEGYALLCATDLTQAKALLDDARPDAMVLDGDLPGVEDPALYGGLRGRTGPPVVVLTSHTGLRVCRVRRDSGRCTYITKPYRLEELRKAVAAAVHENDGARRPQWETEIRGGRSQ